MLLIVCLSALIACAAADSWQPITVFGKYNYHPVTDFCPSKFKGLWYEIKRSPSPFEPDTICSQTDLCLNSNDTFNISTSGLNTITEYNNVWGGTLEPKKSIELADYIFRFPGDAAFTYAVLGTDYDNWSVVAVIDDCHRTNVLKPLKIYVWILGRWPQLEDKYYKCALDVIKKNRLPINALYPVKQTCHK